MLRTIVFVFICIAVTMSLTLNGQEKKQKYAISGYVKDATSGEELIGATVYIKELNQGTVTNVYGFYSLTAPQGQYTVVYSYIGYNDIEKPIELTQDLTISMSIQEQSEQLNEVIISSEAIDANVKNIEMSVAELDVKSIKKIPALLGEADVIKSVQLLPGITTVGEGSSGYNARGGSIDQNLILLDEAPVYNSSHLFGFFSVFNPDAVKNVKLIKGGIPAEYGGRLASILDVRMKEGNKRKYETTGGIGLIFSRLAFEGPIVKDKGSFIVAGRRSYVDVLARPFLNDDLRDSKFHFYDLTAKLNYALSEKDKVFLSGYFGRDVFGTGFGFNWGNSTTTARWNHVFSNKLFSNITAYYSNYDYQFKVGDGEDGFEWNSNTINYSFKPEFTWYLNTNNTIKFGGQLIYYNFKLGDVSFSSGGESNNIGLNDKFALENGIYASNEQKIGALWTIQYGLRYSHYNQLGKDTAYIYGESENAQVRELQELVGYDRGKTIQQYGNIEPRLSIKYDVTDESSIKASYNRMSQYIHLISATTAATPLDIWMPSTNNIKPQIADQVALGYFRNFKENIFEASVEGYFKWTQNQIDYVDNPTVFLNQFVEGELLYGDGRAYGMEFYLKKNEGRFYGFISYTLANTQLKIDDRNNNNWYSNKFDRRHNLNLVANYDLSDRISLSGNFVFYTGTPATFPTNRIQLQEWIIPHNANNTRNNFRISPYHRMDVSLTLGRNPKKEYKNESEWVFSVYNLYSRRNAFSIFFQTNEDNASKTEAIRYSILGTVVPSVTYNFKF